MRFTHFTKVTLTTGIIGLIFLGISSFTELLYHYGLIALLVSGVFFITFFFLITYGEKQKRKSTKKQNRNSPTPRRFRQST
jgi:hypothetical protein